jgi:hypothetical protein
VAYFDPRCADASRAFSFCPFEHGELKTSPLYARPQPASATNDADRRDAERYRWLRDPHRIPDSGDADEHIVVADYGGDDLLWDASLDRAIDAAIAAQRGEMIITIGTCGNCGGRVTVPELWSATVPAVPTCEACGARQKQSHGPVIDMEPKSVRRLDAVGTDGCKATFETTLDSSPKVLVGTIGHVGTDKSTLAVALTHVAAQRGAVMRPDNMPRPFAPEHGEADILAILRKDSRQ